MRRGSRYGPNRNREINSAAMLVGAYAEASEKLPAPRAEGVPITLLEHRFGGNFHRKGRQTQQIDTGKSFMQSFFDKRIKVLALLGTLAATNQYANADVFWSLYLVTSWPFTAEEERYIPLYSFESRELCEESIKSDSYLVAQTPEVLFTLRCIKTDEPVKDLADAQ